MNLLRRLPILMILLAAACTLGSETPTPSSPALPSETASPTDTPSPTRTFTPVPPTLTPSLTAVPTQNIIHPDVVTLCPDQREVPFEELEIDPNFRMIMALDFDADIERVNLGSIRGDDPTMTQIPTLNVDSDQSFEYAGISPNGQWIVYHVWKGEYESPVDSAVWVSSVDGLQQWEVVVFSEENLFQIHPYWQTDEEIFILGGNLRNRRTLSLALGVNPFTLEQRTFTPVPSDSKYYGTFVVNENTYTLYSSNLNILLYNQDTNTEQAVFPWLVDVGLGGYPSAYSNRLINIDETGKIKIVVRKPYGFDITKNLNFDSIGDDLDYEQVMEQVIILEDEAPRTFIAWQYNDSVGYYRRSEPAAFYVYDGERNIIKDYCVDALGNYESLSPDGRFFAWTTLYDEEYGILTYVLDLETGYISKLPGIVVLDWFETTE